LKRIYANDDAKEKAANVLKTIFKLRKSIKTGTINNTVEKFIWLTKLKKQIAVFKNDYRYLVFSKYQRIGLQILKTFLWMKC
jgi:hypothetical protein